MPLRDVVIDERTWEAAPPARRTEWLTAIDELREPGHLAMRPDAERLRVTVTEQAMALDLEGEGGRLLEHVAIPHDVLADHITEYVDIVRQLAKDDPLAGGIARYEALDMAKKVAHDDAAKTVRRAAKAFGMDLGTARRLFTLLFTVRVDTTRLVGVHGHRSIR